MIFCKLYCKNVVYNTYTEYVLIKCVISEVSGQQWAINS